MKKFLVVVDTQYDFVMPNGALYVKGAEDIVVPGIAFLAGLNPDEYEGVLFTYDSHIPDKYNGSPESELFPIHCVVGTPGWNNVFNPELISPRIEIYDLFKGVFDMWEEPGLSLHTEQGLDVLRDEYFRDLLVDGATIEVIGVASDYCVKQCVDGFMKRGFHVEVREELCKGIQQTAREVFTNPEYQTVTIV